MYYICGRSGPSLLIESTDSMIGVNRSEPHTNHSYEKIAVPMYVCMYVIVVLWFSKVYGYCTLSVV